MSPIAQSETAQGPQPGRRWMSVDALRGFDLFWILGADSLAYALHRTSPNGPTNFLAYQLEHSTWRGFRFYDLIFPLFVFIVGVSLVFSLSNTLTRAGRGAALRRIFRRSLLLFALGVFYYGGLAHPWPDIRLLGVLQRIALAYFFAGLLFVFCRPRTLAAVCAGLLLGYWALLAWTPIRDVQLSRHNLAKIALQSGDRRDAALLEKSQPPLGGATRAAADRIFYGTTRYTSGRFEPGLNLANHFDFEYLPGRLYDTFYDPEGILSTIPAVATCLLGVFAGLLLKYDSMPENRKALALAAFGLGSLLLGWVWNLDFPVIKKIWTSSYVLVAGGYSALLLAAFYWVVDVWRYQKWCRPFVWLGMNAITLYLADNILGGFSQITVRLCGGSLQAFLDRRVTQGLGELLVVGAGLLLALALARFLYQRKIFLRL